MNKNNAYRHLVFATIIAVCDGAAYSAEYVVAPTGNDAHAGSPTAPFRTIQKAATVMRAGDRCRIRQGDYFETVRPSADGMASGAIIFQAWPGEQVTIWGTERITGWEKTRDAVYQARLDWDLGKNNQVFINGKMAPEARWPNVKDDDLLTPEGAEITQGGTDFIHCAQLPDGLSDGGWNSAVLWCLAGAKWTSWSTRVDSHEARAKRLRFRIGDSGSIVRNMNPGDRRGGVFYVVGKRELLDAPNEWYVDDAAKRLYLYPPDGAEPNSLQITAKRRMLAFDLSGRSYVHVIGLNVVGATFDLQQCDHCLVQDVRARYISHTRGGNTGYGLNEPTGIRISGQHNAVRDCEIAYSAGSGIEVGGRRNAVINCWIHDIDYLGSYGCPVKTSGTAHLISHNTIHDTGRDCMQPGGQAHIIQHNRMFKMGRICHDLGATYVCGSDGGGTEFRYNWCYDNVAAGTRMGIYLDNFTSNYFVHHNVCWGIGGDEIRLNKPSLYNIVAHNTMLGKTGNWGRWSTDWMYGCVYASNLLTGPIEPHPQIFLAGNVQQASTEAVHETNFTTPGAGVSQGVLVPGISGDFVGAAPDAGAYQTGRPAWMAGHDFDRPPRPVYERSVIPMRNHVKHGSFDWSIYRGQLGPWQKTHAKTARIVRGPGGISQSYTTRNTIINAGVCLGGDENDGILQTISGLRPNTQYDLAGWVKAADATDVRLGVRCDGDEPTVTTVTGHPWTQAHVRFTTSATATSADIFITKRGSGKAYADDIGLVPVLDGFPLAHPGMVIEPAATRD